MTYLQSGKVDNAVNVGVISEHLLERRRVRDVDLDELRALPADQFNAIDHLSGRIVQVVRNDNLVARLEQRKGCEGANVAGATEGKL